MVSPQLSAPDRAEADPTILIDLLSADEASKAVNGRISARQLDRWMLRGVNGPNAQREFLESRRVGRTPKTTLRWIAEFVERISAPRRITPTSQRSVRPSARPSRSSVTQAEGVCRAFLG